MKIISHNISDSAQWKIDRLLAMDADVLVVPEITSKEQVALLCDYEMAWNGITWQWGGKQKCKGLGVIWKKGRGHIPEWYKADLTYAIPLIYEGVLVLAFWPTKCQGVSDRMKYPQIAQQIIGEYAPHFSEQPTVIIGDFNCYVGQSDYTKKYGDMLRINDILEQVGLHCVYHKQTGERFGKETMPTYYHCFNINQPFMLDYAYTNVNEKSFGLLDVDLAMSDHVGLVLEI